MHSYAACTRMQEETLASSTWRIPTAVVGIFFRYNLNTAVAFPWLTLPLASRMASHTDPNMTLAYHESISKRETPRTSKLHLLYFFKGEMTTHPIQIGMMVAIFHNRMSNCSTPQNKWMASIHQILRNEMAENGQGWLSILHPSSAPDGGVLKYGYPLVN